MVILYFLKYGINNQIEPLRYFSETKGRACESITGGFRSVSANALPHIPPGLATLPIGISGAEILTLPSATLHPSRTLGLLMQLPGVQHLVVPGVDPVDGSHSY
jgi:hypothetical protein